MKTINKIFQTAFSGQIFRLVIALLLTAIIFGACDNGTTRGKGGSGSSGTVITIKDIKGVTAPVVGATPVAAITETNQYTGTVKWKGSPAAFTAENYYVATITLKPKGSFTLQGVAANFFTVSGATTANDKNSGVITAVFFPGSGGGPSGPTVINLKSITGVTPPEYTETPVTKITETAQYTGTVTWSPTVSGTFAASTAYTATITLTAKTGFTLTGVSANFFTVAGATATNAANSGVITAVFQATGNAPPTIINIAAIAGVTPPVRSATPVTTITETAQYTGIVSWSPTVSGTFAAETVYTATITLTPKTGYTFNGVSANFFTVAGTSSAATNSANSGVITAVFPATGSAPISIAAITGVTPPECAETPVTIITETAQYTGTVAWSPTVSGTFAATTVYTATITLTPKTGFTLTGVSANFFTVAGTSSAATNSANSGVITAVFPATGSAPPTKVTPGAIGGVTPPVRGATPVTTVTETAQYTGIVSWNPSHSTFAGGTVYTATITLTPKTGYTFSGIAANSFTVAGTSTTATNTANSGVVTAVFPATAVTYSYIITGSGTSFTATGGKLTTMTPTAIQTLIDTIRTDSTPNACSIQFGSGPQLDIGTASIGFTGTWGAITLSGSVTSAIDTTTEGTIYTSGNVSIESRGTINNSAVVASAKAIRNGGTGTVTVSMGTVSAVTGYALYNNSTGTVAVTGGTVSATTGYGIFNNGTGTVTVSGGRVESTQGGMAIRSASNGRVTVSGSSVVTSNSSGEYEGTIYIAGSSTATDRLEITGGTVSNTAANGNTIYINSTGTIAVKGGTVSATTGHAIITNNSGKVTVSGTAEVTSANGNSSQGGTIYINNDFSTERLEIAGGTVTNTSTSTGISAICLATTTGSVTVSGGTVSVTTGYAIYNIASSTVTVTGGRVSATTGFGIRNSTGSVIISGGTVSATGQNGQAVVNSGTGAITLNGNGTIFECGTVTNVNITNFTRSGNGLIICWDNVTYPGPFTAGATTGLGSDPGTATKTWARSGADSGINYTNGTNTGFIKVDGVTVN